jgi:phytoene dehydrogenase-like protein
VSDRVDAIVAGGGANGLTAAAVLARRGARVLLLEREEQVGGLSRTVEFAKGFRVAPLGTDPGWLPPAVERALGLTALERDGRDLPLSVSVEPGRFLTLSRDAARAAEAIRAHSAADAGKWPEFTSRLRALAGFLEVLYQAEPPDVDARSVAEMLSLLQLGRRFRALGRAGMIEFLRTLPMSVWEVLDDWFECAPLKAAVAALGVLDHAQGPRSGGTAFVLLHHLVGAPKGAVRGRPRPGQGPSAFAGAVEELARRHGVTIRTSASVARVRVKDDQVAGVTLEGGEEIDARAVLSTAGPARTLLGWVDPVWLDPEFLNAVRNVRYRGCTAVVAYALDVLPDFPGLAGREALAGTVSLTGSLEALERAADAAKYGLASENPHVELTVPTLRDPGLAPEGAHVLVARAQYAPYHLRDGASWDAARREALADAVTKRIACAAPGFASRVRQRAAWSPHDLEERFGVPEGAASHGELALDQILFMRPLAGWARYATPIRGLYLGGAGTHPGPGVLGGPGWLAARRLMADRRPGRAGG